MADTGPREELLGLTSTGGKRRRVVDSGRKGGRPGGQSLRDQAIWGGGREAGANRIRSGVDG